jgi:hypothetical protein
VWGELPGRRDGLEELAEEDRRGETTMVTPPMEVYTVILSGCATKAKHEHNNWICDLNLRTSFTPMHLLQFTTLWNLIVSMVLHPQHEELRTRSPGHYA